MGNDKVTSLPATVTFTVEQALHSALQLNMKDVLIIGYDQNNELVIRSSRIDRKTALWLVRDAEDYVRGVE